MQCANLKKFDLSVTIFTYYFYYYMRTSFLWLISGQITSSVSKVFVNFALIPIIILSVILYFSLDSESWIISGIDHFYFEMISVILSFIVAFYCILRGYVLKDKLSIFLGLGFQVAGVIDLLHGAFAFLNIDQLSFESYFIPQTWVAGRLLMGIVMMMAIARLSNPGKHKKKQSARSIRKEVLIYTFGLTGFGILITVWSLIQPFPFVTIDFIIKRPYEIIAAAFFVTALILFFKKRLYENTDKFYKGILLSLVIDVFVNLIISQSSFVFDTSFNVAHTLKNLSYFVLIMTISISISSHFKIQSKLSKSLSDAYEKLEFSEKKYKDLYEKSTDLYRTIDTSGKILDCNEMYYEKLGYTKKEVIGSSIFDHVDTSELPAMRESFNTWKNTGRVLSREVRLMKKNGSTFPTLISANNLYNKNGKLIGSNTNITDVSKLNKLRNQLEDKEKTIREQYYQLKKSSKAKDEFTGMITHELKTPLVPIKSYTEMLLSEQFGPLNKEQKNRLEIVKSNINHLERILSDFFDVIKIELDQLKLMKDVYDLSEIIKEVIAEMEPSVHDKGITIKTNLQNNILCSCDKTRIEQILLNLITNSMKFSKRGDKITIKLYKNDPYAEIEVKDEGIGIKKDSLETIFVKFYQSDTSSTRKYGGTGLGLSVCKGIIESHFGRIWAESEGEGKGTNIHFLLPLSEKLVG